MKKEKKGKRRFWRTLTEEYGGLKICKIQIYLFLFPACFFPIQASEKMSWHNDTSIWSYYERTVNQKYSLGKKKKSGFLIYKGILSSSFIWMSPCPLVMMPLRLTANVETGVETGWSLKVPSISNYSMILILWNLLPSWASPSFSIAYI